VEAVTGGRRMADVMTATLEALSSLVTQTGRPKAGGRYATATEERDRLAAEEKRLSADVTSLREALDQRAVALRRLAELEVADDKAARRQAIEAAQIAHDAARAQDTRLKAAQAERNLARELYGNVDREHQRFEDALNRARALRDLSQAADGRRAEAMDRRRDVTEAIDKARQQADVAEAEETAARDLLERLDAAIRAQESYERLAELKDRLQRAETVRQGIEENEAQLAHACIPAGAIDEVADLDIELSRLRALRDARRPTVTVAYETGATTRISLGDDPLADGEERGYDGQARLTAPGIGAITLRSNQSEDSDDRLAQVEQRRSILLASMGVTDLAAARAQQERAQQFESQAREGRAQMTLLAPDGLAKLREEVMAHASVDAALLELKADPIQTRSALNDAVRRRKQAAQDLRTTDSLRASADDTFVRAETDLAKIQTEMLQIHALIGPNDETDERARELAERLAPLRNALAKAESDVVELEAAAVDLESAAAALARTRSVEQVVETQIVQLRETLAGLNAQISTRSDEAVEEKWRETREALTSAESRATAFEKEVAVLQRVSGALENARAQARELYLKPVMTELRPLLGLLFDDVSITFDDKTLLPQKIMRNGLEEEIERLSGGMREQLSILTRLAFARLLARDGRPAPVILDDALVYSDDDRIEKMFDALHRQSRDQQIIVFSCRQRAFQKLGGNVLQLTDWRP
jgi:DNA repair exonuclease SbcCD ATPase subunit